MDEKSYYHLGLSSHSVPSADPYFHSNPSPSIPSSSPRQYHPLHYSASRPPSPAPLYPTTGRPTHASAYSRPRCLRIENLLRPWLPVILYALTTLGFLAAVGFWKAEVFQGLDQLSRWLKSDEYTGYLVMFLLIFLTTIPPLPLYSTLIILSGYTFGAWTGAVISYLASLSGALIVFVSSRAFFRDSISRWLSCTITVKRVVRAIEKRPKLLFLIRLAPYPYNVMNCLLAASPTLTLRTYTICTALSLFKLIIHTSIGSSIHSFAEYHVSKPGQPPHDTSQEAMLGHYSTIIGVALCVAIFVYLSIIARRAVDDELHDNALNREETIAFLSDEEAADGEEAMSESPFRTLSGSRPAGLSRPSELLTIDSYRHNEDEETSIGLGQ